MVGQQCCCGSEQCAVFSDSELRHIIGGRPPARLFLVFHNFSYFATPDGVEIREPSALKLLVVLRTKINGDFVAKIVMKILKQNFSASALYNFSTECSDFHVRSTWSYLPVSPLLTEWKLESLRL